VADKPNEQDVIGSLYSVGGYSGWRGVIDVRMELWRLTGMATVRSTIPTAGRLDCSHGLVVDGAGEVANMW
jgi:hypothetical protein